MSRKEENGNMETLATSELYSNSLPRRLPGIEEMSPPPRMTKCPSRFCPFFVDFSSKIVYNTHQFAAPHGSLGGSYSGLARRRRE